MCENCEPAEGAVGAGDGAQGPRSTDTDRYRKQQKQSFNYHAEWFGEFSSSRVFSFLFLLHLLNLFGFCLHLTLFLFDLFFLFAHFVLFHALELGGILTLRLRVLTQLQSNLFMIYAHLLLLIIQLVLAQ